MKSIDRYKYRPITFFYFIFETELKQFCLHFAVHVQILHDFTVNNIVITVAK